MWLGPRQVELRYPAHSLEHNTYRRRHQLTYESLEWKPKHVDDVDDDNPTTRRAEHTDFISWYPRILVCRDLAWRSEQGDSTG